MTMSRFPNDQLPRFNDIDTHSIKSQVEHYLEQNRSRLQALLAIPSYTFENLMQPLEEMSDELNQYWSPISHLHAVMETENLRKAYNETLPLITEYHTELSQNEQLFKAVSDIEKNQTAALLNAAQQKIIELDLRDFKLAGIHLSADKKAKMAALQQQLSQLMTRFSENVLDATHAYILPITDEKQLAGLPESALKLAMDNAKERGLMGYVFTLDYPSYSTALKFLRDRTLRKTLYEAYTTRASDQGPQKGQWDNTAIMEALLKTRHELANLVGFANYANYSLATKMAKTPQEVLGFLQDLLTRSKPIAEKEYQEICAFAKSEDGLSTLEAWDLAYYSEQLQARTFHFTQEDIRPYFPINHVLSGLFTIMNKLYGLTIKQEEGIEVWHKDVQFFSIYDESEQLRGGFYIDLYARQHKRDGAWMDDCRTRHLLADKKIQYPVAYLTCNFMPPTSDTPALLTHDDVLTLFHEFGHCLHHMMTKVAYPSVAGINGVPWDAVEFPSQFLENYCWEKEALALIAKHYQTGAPLPDELYQKMLAAKHFQTGLQMVRQIEFALFDFRLHLEYDPDKTNQVQTVLDEVRKEATVIPVPEFNRFQHSFSHIFAGSYAAGYYSYKWAEVLSADAYSKFEEQGLFNRDVGKSYLENILEVGGVRDPMTSFIAFRGRPPTIDALLRLSGIVQ